LPDGSRRAKIPCLRIGNGSARKGVGGGVHQDKEKENAVAC